MKLLVTHISPDLDAVTSLWLFVRFYEQKFGEAEFAFVPAGKKLSQEEIEEKGYQFEDVVHVDTGKGEFDHHMEELANKKICAASLVLDHIVRVHPELSHDQGLRRLINHVVEIDHFGEFYWPEPNHDRYLLQFHEVLAHIKSLGGEDIEVVTYGFQSLDAIYNSFKARVSAEQDLKKGQEFETKWGVGFGVESNNDEVLKFAQKAGYTIVVRKDPDEEHIRIKAAPGKEIDLTPIYEKILAKDSNATWFLHPSKAMLLNGSRRNSEHIPSQLSLQDVIQIFETTR